MCLCRDVYVISHDALLLCDDIVTLGDEGKNKEAGFSFLTQSPIQWKHTHRHTLCMVLQEKHRWKEKACGLCDSACVCSTLY